MKKIKKKTQSEKPLTLEVLVNYNQKVLFPFLEEHFVNKKEFKYEIENLKKDLHVHKKEFTKSQNTNITYFDKILKELEILKTEKEVRKYQRDKDKKLWLFIIQALKEHNILTSTHLKQIAEMGIF